MGPGRIVDRSPDRGAAPLRIRGHPAGRRSGPHHPSRPAPAAQRRSGDGERGRRSRRRGGRESQLLDHPRGERQRHHRRGRTADPSVAVARRRPPGNHPTPTHQLHGTAGDLEKSDIREHDRGPGDARAAGPGLGRNRRHDRGRRQFGPGLRIRALGRRILRKRKGRVRKPERGHRAEADALDSVAGRPFARGARRRRVRPSPGRRRGPWIQPRGIGVRRMATRSRRLVRRRRHGRRPDHDAPDPVEQLHRRIDAKPRSRRDPPTERLRGGPADPTGSRQPRHGHPWFRHLEGRDMGRRRRRGIRELPGPGAGIDGQHRGTLGDHCAFRAGSDVRTPCFRQRRRQRFRPGRSLDPLLSSFGARCRRRDGHRRRRPHRSRRRGPHLARHLRDQSTHRRGRNDRSRGRASGRPGRSAAAHGRDQHIRRAANADRRHLHQLRDRSGFAKRSRLGLRRGDVAPGQRGGRRLQQRGRRSRARIGRVFRVERP